MINVWRCFGGLKACLSSWKSDKSDSPVSPKGLPRTERVASLAPPARAGVAQRSAPDGHEEFVEEQEMRK